jgi:hypothetical protein
MDFPNFAFSLQRSAHVQTGMHLAVVACALERYRLRQGGYPSTLAALVPELLEKRVEDAITSQPFKYARTADGQFLLYSVGWNQKDDRGQIAGTYCFDQGDWVWRYPAR